MSDQEKAIVVKNVHKTFRLPHEQYTSLKNRLLHKKSRKKGYELQHVLKDISFEVEKGEFFGVVGRNGSGKSTLLKLMAGVYVPDSGEIQVNGSLSPFIELGVGFNPELTGRENVFLNGALLGFNRKEMLEMYDEIVEFAELEQFMDQKLNNYSSGMQVRLAFSIAIRARGDILVLDEVLAVGDTAFQKKCHDYFEELKRERKTIVLVTHNMAAVEQFCDKAMLLNDGELVAVSDDPAYIADLYNELNLKTSEPHLEKQNAREVQRAEKRRFGTGDARIRSAGTYSVQTGHPQNTFTNKEKIAIKYIIEAAQDVPQPKVGVIFKDKKGNITFATNTFVKAVKIKDFKKDQRIEVSFAIDNVFNNGTYTISGAIASIDGSVVYDKVENIHEFEIGGWKMTNSLTQPPHKIAIKY